MFIIIYFYFIVDFKLSIFVFVCDFFCGIFGGGQIDFCIIYVIQINYEIFVCCGVINEIVFRSFNRDQYVLFLGKKDVFLDVVNVFGFYDSEGKFCVNGFFLYN